MLLESNQKLEKALLDNDEMKQKLISIAASRNSLQKEKDSIQ